MKFTKQTIKQILQEEIARKNKLKKAAKTIKEDDQSPYPGAMRDVAPVPEQPNVSLDQAVDRYFVRYEREAIPSSAMYESAFAKGSLVDLFEAIMKEQDDPMAADPAGADMGADDGGGLGDMGGDDSGGGGGDQPGPSLTKTPRIDINSFAMSVARLVNNYESLIDPKSIIINRAQQYIKNNYDERTGKEFVDILKNNYDLQPMTTQAAVYGDENGSQFPDPQMVGSGGGGSLTAPSGGGGGGGE